MFRLNKDYHNTANLALCFQSPAETAALTSAVSEAALSDLPPSRGGWGGSNKVSTTVSSVSRESSDNSDTDITDIIRKLGIFQNNFSHSHLFQLEVHLRGLLEGKMLQKDEKKSDCHYCILYYSMLWLTGPKLTELDGHKWDSEAMKCFICKLLLLGTFCTQSEPTPLFSGLLQNMKAGTSVSPLFLNGKNDNAAGWPVGVGAAGC